MNTFKSKNNTFTSTYMERLNKNQRKLLDILNSKYPDADGLNDSEVIKGLKERNIENPESIIPDIKMLEDSKLIEPVHVFDNKFPVSMRITSAGREKLNETFKSRIMDSAHKNPWVIVSAISVVVAACMLISGAYFASENYRLSVENSQLQKPSVITPDKRVLGNEIADLSFVVKNPSHSTDYYYEGGKCNPTASNLFSVPQNTNNPNTQKQSNSQSVPDVSIPSSQINVIPIPANSEITLQCTNNYVTNPNSDVTTYMDVCVNIRNIQDPICNRMKITVLKV